MALRCENGRPLHKYQWSIKTGDCEQNLGSLLCVTGSLPVVQLCKCCREDGPDLSLLQWTYQAGWPILIETRDEE